MKGKMMKKTVVALVYDFDETLSTTYMQDYVLIPELGMSPKTFWKKANQWSVDNCADQITGSMYYFMKTAREKGVRLTRENFAYCGTLVKYYKGVEGWFERINAYGEKLGLKIEHYIISSGYEEILCGASISKYFTDIYGCSYAFGEDGTPVWPARVVNYSTKVQYISKINKGIAVYKPKSAHKEKAIKLLRDDRVNFALPADYSEGTAIDTVVKTILDKLATERNLDELKKKEEEKKNKK